MSLNQKQKLQFRSQAHTLKPVILIGNAGYSDKVHAELENALLHHELLKIKINAGERDERTLIVTEICNRTGADLVQQLGKTCVIYKKRPNS